MYTLTHFPISGGPLKTQCEINGEHHGDTRTHDDAHGRWEIWTCCDERTYLGELIDCDTCLEPGLVPTGTPMPAGWVEDTNGHHCPRCQAPKDGAR